MYGKRKLNYDYKRLKKIKARYILILALFFLVLGIQGMRQNYAEMVRLRQAVTVADEQNGDVETALRELRQHVYNHMNTNLASGNVAIKPPIQLKYRYERLAKAHQERINQQNAQVKQTGEQICASQHPGGGLNSPRVACVAEYVRVNSVKDSPVPNELYKFDFASPAWSPDFAGISLLLSLIFFAGFLASLMAGWWYRFRLG